MPQITNRLRAKIFHFSLTNSQKNTYNCTVNKKFHKSPDGFLLARYFHKFTPMLVGDLRVAAVESSAINKAERNTAVTSIIICCGFIVCWTPSEVMRFLRYIGYNNYLGTWFYHFTSVDRNFFKHSS